MTGRPQSKLVKNKSHYSVFMNNILGTKSSKGDGKAKRKQSIDCGFPVKFMGENTKPKEV